MFSLSSASRASALFEPLPLDGGGVGERVTNETFGVSAADPLSRRAARADLSRKGRGMQSKLDTDRACA